MYHAACKDEYRPLFIELTTDVFRRCFLKYILTVDAVQFFNKIENDDASRYPPSANRAAAVWEGIAYYQVWSTTPTKFVARKFTIRTAAAHDTTCAARSHQWR